MELARVRRLPWPELTLLAFGLLFVLGLMYKSSSEQCHEWRERLSRVTGAFLAAAVEEEYPLPDGNVAPDREPLRNATRRLLDERPFGCL